MSGSVGGHQPAAFIETVVGDKARLRAGERSADTLIDLVARPHRVPDAQFVHLPFEKVAIARGALPADVEWRSALVEGPRSRDRSVQNTIDIKTLIRAVIGHSHVGPCIQRHCGTRSVPSAGGPETDRPRIAVAQSVVPNLKDVIAVAAAVAAGDNRIASSFLRENRRLKGK